MKPYDDARFSPSQRSSYASSQERRRLDASEEPSFRPNPRKRSDSNVGDAWNKIASELERIDSLSSEDDDFENWNVRDQSASDKSPRVSKNSTDVEGVPVRNSDVPSSSETARDSLRRAANAFSNEDRVFFNDDKLSEDYETRNKRRSKSVWRSGDWFSRQSAKVPYENAPSCERQTDVANRRRSDNYDSNQRIGFTENARDYDGRRRTTPQNSTRSSRFSNPTERSESARRVARRNGAESTSRWSAVDRDANFRENGSRSNDSFYNPSRYVGRNFEKTGRSNGKGAYERTFSPERNDFRRRPNPRRLSDSKSQSGAFGKYGDPLSLAEAYARRDDRRFLTESLETRDDSVPVQTDALLESNSAELALLQEKSIYELIEEARRLDGDPRGQIVKRVLRERVLQAGMTFGAGTLEILPDGFGFLRSVDTSYLSCSDDVYVSPSQIRRFGLRCGLVVSGLIRPPKERERYFALLRIDSINGKDPNILASTPYFDDLVAARPTERLQFEQRPEKVEGASPDETKSSLLNDFSEEAPNSPIFDAGSTSPTFIEAAEASKGRDMRLLDVVLPIGFGQRALIVCPPRSGKTLFMRKMVKAALENYDDLFALVLLVKKRPEDATETRRLLASDRCEVVGSTFDESDARHIQIARTLFEKAKRMVEYGRRVVVFVDSTTRLIGALRGEERGEHNMSAALQHARKLFGSSRKIDGGGSLTIVAASLWNKDDPNAQTELDALQNISHATLWLDSELAEKNIWPPIDVVKSSARDCSDFVSEEEGLFLKKVRESVQSQNATEALEELLGRIDQTSNNLEFQRALISDSSEKEQ